MSMVGGEPGVPLNPQRFLGAQSGDSRACLLQGALDVARRGPSGHIVEGKHFSKAQASVKTGVEAGMDRLQVGKR